MPRIRFYREIREARILNPFSGFLPEVQPIEVRLDPLSGYPCRINVRRAERMRRAGSINEESFREALEASKKSCYFCPESLERLTPMFPKDLVPEGRMRLNSARLFPNLYPFAEHHAVAIFTETPHFLELGDFTPSLLEDCFALAIDYLRLVASKQYPRLIYGSINWNYGLPAGASILHPHLQIIADAVPTKQVSVLMKMSEEYYERVGSNYWLDLIEVERELGERFVAEKDGIAWLASFAPQGNREFMAIVRGRSSITDMDKGCLKALSEGLLAILKFYQAQGVKSFNLASFSGPALEGSRSFLLSFKILSRPLPQPFYVSDAGFMERLQGETIVDTKPEDLAKELKAFFQ
jgi:UDPglucose--hexose-1-phosphate uridylyltransferase